MLQQDEPDDHMMAISEMHTVREFVARMPRENGLRRTTEWYETAHRAAP